jgi:hypothetical protein
VTGLFVTLTLPLLPFRRSRVGVAIELPFAEITNSYSAVPNANHVSIIHGGQDALDHAIFKI